MCCAFQLDCPGWAADDWCTSAQDSMANLQLADIDLTVTVPVPSEGTSGCAMLSWHEPLAMTAQRTDLPGLT